jgi:tight adherence protein B
MPVLAFVLVVAGSLTFVARGHRRGIVERRLISLGGLREESHDLTAPTARGVLRRLVSLDVGEPASAALARGAVVAGLGGLVGIRIAGAPGALLGAAVAVGVIHALRKSQAGRRAQTLERQLAEVVDACSLAVRGGASVSQAVTAGAEEVEEPMRSLVERVVSGQALGTPFEDALGELAGTLGTEDARLFALVMGIHHRSGGNVVAPLKEVATTIRHRIAVRRELRALTAQARISGIVLGALPISFFLVLSATSHRELAPVYRSSAGIAMIVGGLVLEAIAFVWIRHLIRVEA